MPLLDSDQLEQLENLGFLKIPSFISEQELEALRGRLDSIIEGRHQIVGGELQIVDGEVRKLRNLETDDVFHNLFASARVKDICRQVVGDKVSIMRASLINKYANGGKPLGWHQDVSKHWPMSAPPLLTFWFALDDASKESGCMEVVPGSHKYGPIGDGHYLPAEFESQYIGATQLLEVNAGGCILFYCSLLHRSGSNVSKSRRRAVNLVVMDGDIIHTGKNERYPLLLDPLAAP
jgi:phytanoyl-CoA hydroxylase